MMIITVLRTAKNLKTRNIGEREEDSFKTDVELFGYHNAYFCKFSVIPKFSK